MAKKTPSTPSKSKPAVKKTATSPVRKTTVPRPTNSASKSAVAAPKVVSHDDVARRAYALWQSGAQGSDFDRWCQAERELRG